MKKVLTVAGSDSGGCAGIQADIKAISACGAFAASAITAVTSQNTLGVDFVEELTPTSIKTQIEAVLSDIGADAVKSGMLFSKEIVCAVSEVFKKYSVKNYVLDPVMIASSGAKLLKESAVEALKENLIPLCSLITPNIPEAESLSGIKIETDHHIKEACSIIKTMGAGAVLVKGGHLKGEYSTDTLFDGEKYYTFTTKRIPTNNTHGTGCTYSAAIATFLAMGFSMNEAVDKAKNYISAAIEGGKDLKIGSGAGPVDHFFALRS